jgi:hypothetical protein
MCWLHDARRYSCCVWPVAPGKMSSHMDGIPNFDHWTQDGHVHDTGSFCGCKRCTPCSVRHVTATTSSHYWLEVLMCLCYKMLYRCSCHHQPRVQDWCGSLCLPASVGKEFRNLCQEDVLCGNTDSWLRGVVCTSQCNVHFTEQGLWSCCFTMIAGSKITCVHKLPKCALRALFAHTCVMCY